MDLPEPPPTVPGSRSHLAPGLPAALMAIPVVILTVGIFASWSAGIVLAGLCLAMGRAFYLRRAPLRSVLNLAPPPTDTAPSDPQAISAGPSEPEQ